MKNYIILLSLLLTSLVFGQADREINFSTAQIKESTTPSNPPAGSYKVYAKNDGSLYLLDSAGLEVEIGSGGGVNAWVTTTAYEAGDVVIESAKIYRCLINHTSGTFATDLAGLNWEIISDGLTTVNLATNVTGVLPIANGGSNKNLTLSAGGIPYFDADSFEVLSAGSAGQIVQSNGASAPTFVNKSISAKSENQTAVTAEEIQVPNNLLTATDTNKQLIEIGNNNLLVNPSFEHSTYDSSWTMTAGGGTHSSESSIVLNGKKSAKATVFAGTPTMSQDSTLYQAQLSGVPCVASAWIKSNSASVEFCARQAGTNTGCVTVSDDDQWHPYAVQFTCGATSNGVFIGMPSTGTGTFYADNVYVGPKTPTPDIDAINPNYVINGNFDFWQRGTTNTTANTFMADRFQNGSSGTTFSFTRQSTAFTESFNSTYYGQNVVTSVAGASNYSIISYKMPSVRRLAGKTVTLSFWAKADSAKPVAVEFLQSFGTGGSPSSSVTALGVYKPTLTTSFVKYTATVTLPSISGKTLGTDENSYTGIFFWFDAGSTYDSRTLTLGQQSGTFSLAQIKLEEGSTVTPFVLAGGTLQGEFAACQRYYQNPAMSADGTGDSRLQLPAWGNGAATISGTYNFPVAMRKAPTVTIDTYTNWRAYQASGAALAGASAIAASQVSNGKMNLNFTCTATANNVGVLSYANGSNTPFTLDAEL